MGIIAQDSILVSGSLRLNLDIEGRYTDSDLYEALRQVQLIGPDTPGDGMHSETSSVTVVGPDDAQPAKQNGRGAPANVFHDLDDEIESGGQK